MLTELGGSFFLPPHSSRFLRLETQMELNGGVPGGHSGSRSELLGTEAKYLRMVEWYDCRHP